MFLNEASEDPVVTNSISCDRFQTMAHTDAGYSTLSLILWLVQGGNFLQMVIINDPICGSLSQKYLASS